MGAWDHDELAADLAAHLRGPGRMVWADMQLGPAGSPRPDVYTIDRSYAYPKPRAYEIKVSVSDFRADVTAGKWMSYLDYAESVTFAAPAGLISKADLPPRAGLMIRGDTGWRTVKRPTRQAVTIPEAACLKLLIDGVDREGGVRLDVGRQWRADKLAAARFGRQIADCIRDASAVEERVRHAKAEAAAIVEGARARAAREREREASQVADLWSDIRRAFGLPDDATVWDAHREIGRLKELSQGMVGAATVKHHAKAARGALERLFAALEERS